MAYDKTDQETLLDDAAHLRNSARTCEPRDTGLTQVPSRRVRRGNVYFAQAGDAIKIGFSTNSGNRLSALQTSNAENVVLLGAIKGTQDDERDLHQRFCHLRLRGEWFRAEDELIEFIAQNHREPRRSPASPETLATIKKLVAKRNWYGADTPIGHRYSNLIEQVRNLEDPEINKDLMGRAIAGTVAEIERLQRALHN